MPSLSASLVRGAVTSPFKRAGRNGATLPAARLTLPAAPVAPGPLATYLGICGFTEPGSTAGSGRAATGHPLPLTYPHVLAFPLAMRLMTGRAFPLPVVGLVHTWIEITRHRTARADEPLELTAYAAELTPHRRGTEVTMVTEARVAGALVWESRSGYLSRHATPPGAGRDADTGTGAEAGARAGAEAEADAGGRSPAVRPSPPATGSLPPVAEWRLPGDLGRRYGAASGDRNPIHLYPLTARLFGFPRAIAHGMWTVARCLAEAGEPELIRHVRADFRAPVLLPATVTYAADASGGAFELRGGSGGRLHLTGTLTRDT
ncbi:MaoC/PaaZ C-terminal domain-containing protein [Streptomyces sp. NBC_00654]|uniref:MaoC/PaaZ C-terminal domain-containing protein n=1 Tax=Streptomyces sp. NBC_00654 TaxID=2975799 RepID=UPI002252E4D0|nr:MaoC/PaaZ C-terminal domain-containing protein [Streptomyces sp. NBC_00654]MCX4964010.1 MaoC/PaaZ C-terminal domain-containing protein [Streptomyces sp. NBC_00654]